MNQLKLTIASFALMLSAAVSAQTTVTNVLSLRSTKQSGEIIENNKIAGYYIFYFKEKADKNNSSYEVDLFDDNYNKLKNFTITRPKNTYMLEMVFNGEVFMLHFYDRKTGYEFVTFDREGKQLGSTKVNEKDISKYDLQRVAANQQSETENVSIFPLGNEGFIRQSFTKNDKLGYKIVCYDNSAKEIWTYGSSETSDKVESADIVEVDQDLIALNVAKKKNLTTKKMDSYCTLLNSKTGTLITEVSLGSEDEGKQSLTKAFIDNKSNRIIVIGEFFKPGDDMLKDKSIGLYMREFDKAGKEVTKKEYLWKGDIDKFKQANLDEEDKKDANKPYFIMFHDVIRAENGHLFLIGEQFKKQLSAGGMAGNIASAALGGGSNTSSFEILVANMIVIEFDEKNNLVDFDLISKKKTSVLLPAGAGYYSSAFLGYYLKSLGAFDYSFTSGDKATDKYNIVYIDANRKEEKGSAKSDMMIGVITIEGGKKNQERVPVNTKSRNYWLQPAKPGYIAIGEYDRKAKTISLHLEQLSY